MAAADGPCLARAGEIWLQVHLTPRAAVDRVGGVKSVANGARLKVRVRALPHGGAANVALIAVLADWLGVAKSRVRLRTGVRSRLKGVAVIGACEAMLAYVKSRLDTGRT